MYKQSKVSDINIHHFGFRFSGLVPIRDVAAASLLALYAVCNSRAPVCIPKPARARRASTVASRRRAMALGAGAAAAARKGETEQGEDVEKFRHSASFHRVIFRQLKDRLTRDRDRLALSRRSSNIQTKAEPLKAKAPHARITSSLLAPLMIYLTEIMF